MLSLDSVLAKIERAHEHARLIDQELDAWIEENPYAISLKINSDCTRHSIVFSILKPPPLQRWSLIFGDAIHNLRSALDHLVYAISVHDLKADPPPNEGRSAFLINDAPNDFRSKYWRIADLSQPIRDAIESVQPYKRPRAPMPPLLSILRDFDDADKHRLIKVVLQRPIAFKIEVKGPGLIPADHHFESPYVDLVDGAEIAWVTSKYPTPHLQLQANVTASIAVEHAPGPGPDGIERTGIERLLLEDLLPEVREVVRIVSAAVGA
jgi:hypothetical protein